MSDQRSGSAWGWIKVGSARRGVELEGGGISSAGSERWRWRGSVAGRRGWIWRILTWLFSIVHTYKRYRISKIQCKMDILDPHLHLNIYSKYKIIFSYFIHW